MDFRVGCGLPDGTRLDGGSMIDTDSARYAVEARLRSFDLATSLPYLQVLFQSEIRARQAGLRLSGKAELR